MGVLDEIKTILSPAGAWLWAELGNIEGMKTVSVAALLVSCKRYFNKRLVKIRPLSARVVY